jgi:hypothetical protein
MPQDIKEDYIGSVVCIDNKGTHYYNHYNCNDTCCQLQITIGKVYKHIPYGNIPGFSGISGLNKAKDMYYKIIDDSGNAYRYYKKHFITLEEHRNNKLNSLVD